MNNSFNWTPSGTAPPAASTPAPAASTPAPAAAAAPAPAAVAAPAPAGAANFFHGPPPGVSTTTAASPGVAGGAPPYGFTYRPSYMPYGFTHANLNPGSFSFDAKPASTGGMGFSFANAAYAGVKTAPEASAGTNTKDADDKAAAAAAAAAAAEDEDLVEIVEGMDDANAWGHFYCAPCKVPTNSQVPNLEVNKTKFLNVSNIPPGSLNVILPGPFVIFWCQDCGRQLAPRSISEHWAKAHESLHNLNGLQNVAAHAMAQYHQHSTPKGKTAKAAAAMASGTVKFLASVRTKSSSKNPFFIALDSMPEDFIKTWTKKDFQNFYDKMKGQLSKTHSKQAESALARFEFN